MVKRRQAKRGVATQSIEATPIANREGEATKVVAATEVEPWAKSRAKDVARELLMDPNSYVHGMPATHIYYTNSLFTLYKKDRFTTNYNNLKKKLEKEKKSIEFDQRAFNREKVAFPRKSKTNRGYPFWDTHPAKTLLVDELNKGLHIGKMPKEVQSTNALFKEFPNHIFARNYQREVRGLRESVFWQAKRNLKGREKHDKEVQHHNGPVGLIHAPAKESGKTPSKRVKYPPLERGKILIAALKELVKYSSYRLS